MTSIPRAKWWHIKWFSDEDTPEERRWLLKLDLLVVPFGILAYWVKYLDQSNLSAFADNHSPAEDSLLLFG
jgi:hypothetical protein